MLGIRSFGAYFHTIAIGIDRNCLVIAIACAARPLKNWNSIGGKSLDQLVNQMICANLNGEMCKPQRLGARYRGREPQRGRLHNFQTGAMAEQKKQDSKPFAGLL